MSLTINAILMIGFLQLRGQLDVVDDRIQRVVATQAESQDLMRWMNRMRDCLVEMDAPGDTLADLQKSCGSP